MNMSLLSMLDNNESLVQYIKEFINDNCDSFSDILRIVVTTLHLILALSNSEE